MNFPFGWINASAEGVVPAEAWIDALQRTTGGVFASTAGDLTGVLNTMRGDVTGLLGSLLAQDAPVAPPPAQSEFLPMFITVGAIMLVFYFIFLRPQRNEQKKREEMLNQLSKGDHVVTAGGIHGTVEAIDQSNGIVSVSVAPKTTIRVNRSSLGSVTPKGRGKKSEAAESESKA